MTENGVKNNDVEKSPTSQPIKRKKKSINHPEMELSSCLWHFSFPCSFTIYTTCLLELARPGTWIYIGLNLAMQWYHAKSESSADGIF